MPLFERATEVFGDFDLDACANSSNHLCDRYFSLAGIDGREEDWWEHGSNIWCNPVYSRNKEDMAWPLKKAIEACEHGCSVTFLVFARFDTEWAHKYVLGKADIHCIEGRVRFSMPAPAPRGFPPDMKRKPVAPAPSVLLHFTQETVAGARPTLIRSFSETCASVGLSRPQLWDNYDMSNSPQTSALESRVEQGGSDAST